MFLCSGGQCKKEYSIYFDNLLVKKKQKYLFDWKICLQSMFKKKVQGDHPYIQIVTYSDMFIKRTSNFDTIHRYFNKFYIWISIRKSFVEMFRKYVHLKFKFLKINLIIIIGLKIKTSKPIMNS